MEYLGEKFEKPQDFTRILTISHNSNPIWIGEGIMEGDEYDKNSYHAKFVKCGVKNGELIFPKGLISIKLNYCVTRIGLGFNREDNLKIKKLVLPEGLLSVELDRKPHHFYEEPKITFKFLEYLYIPETLIDIAHKSFQGLQYLKEVYFHPKNKIEKIDDYSFYRCDSLHTVVLSDNIKELGINSFSHTSISHVVTRESDKLNNEFLNHLSIPQGLDVIKDTAIKAPNLQTVILPNEMEYIGPNSICVSKFTNICKLPLKVHFLDSSCLSPGLADFVGFIRLPKTIYNFNLTYYKNLTNKVIGGINESYINLDIFSVNVNDLKYDLKHSYLKISDNLDKSKLRDSNKYIKIQLYTEGEYEKTKFIDISNLHLASLEIEGVYNTSYLNIFKQENNKLKYLIPIKTSLLINYGISDYSYVRLIKYSDNPNNLLIFYKDLINNPMETLYDKKRYEFILNTIPKMHDKEILIMMIFTLCKLDSDANIIEILDKDLWFKILDRCLLEINYFINKLYKISEIYQNANKKLSNTEINPTIDVVDTINYIGKNLNGYKIYDKNLNVERVFSGTKLAKNLDFKNEVLYFLLEIS